MVTLRTSGTERQSAWTMTASRCVLSRSSANACGRIVDELARSASSRRSFVGAFEHVRRSPAFAASSSSPSVSSAIAELVELEPLGGATQRADRRDTDLDPLARDLAPLHVDHEVAHVAHVIRGELGEQLAHRARDRNVACPARPRRALRDERVERERDRAFVEALEGRASGGHGPMHACGGGGGDDQLPGGDGVSPADAARRRRRERPASRAPRRPCFDGDATPASRAGARASARAPRRRARGLRRAAAWASEGESRRCGSDGSGGGARTRGAGHPTASPSRPRRELHRPRRPSRRAWVAAGDRSPGGRPPSTMRSVPRRGARRSVRTTRRWRHDDRARREPARRGAHCCRARQARRAGATPAAPPACASSRCALQPSPSSLRSRANNGRATPALASPGSSASGLSSGDRDVELIRPCVGGHAQSDVLRGQAYQGRRICLSNPATSFEFPECEQRRNQPTCIARDAQARFAHVEVMGHARTRSPSCSRSPSASPASPASARAAALERAGELLSASGARAPITRSGATFGAHRIVVRGRRRRAQSLSESSIARSSSADGEPVQASRHSRVRLASPARRARRVRAHAAERQRWSAIYRSSATCSPKIFSRPESTSSLDLDAERLAEREERLGAVLHREHERDGAVARPSVRGPRPSCRAALRSCFSARRRMLTCFVSVLHRVGEAHRLVQEERRLARPLLLDLAVVVAAREADLPGDEHRLAAVSTGAYVSIWLPRTLHLTRPVRSSSSKKAILPPPSLKMRSR